MKRTIVRIQWDSRRQQWKVTNFIGDLSFSLQTKAALIRDVAAVLRADAKGCRQPAQLVVHNKNGRIAFERTYLNDPRRRKG